MKRFLFNIHIKNYNSVIVKYNMNHEFMSLIYSLLRDTGMCSIHNSNDVKNFTFSDIIFESYKATNRGIKLKSPRAAIAFSTSNPEISSILENVLKSNNGKTFKLSNLFINMSIYNSESVNIESNLFHMKTLSPVYISKDKKDNLSPSTDEYLTEVKENIYRRIGYRPKIDLHILNHKSKLVNFKKTKLRGNMLEFFLKSDDVNVINTLLYSGLGSKTSLGFGMLDIIKHEKV